VALASRRTSARTAGSRSRSSTGSGGPSLRIAQLTDC